MRTHGAYLRLLSFDTTRQPSQTKHPRRKLKYLFSAAGVGWMMVASALHPAYSQTQEDVKATATASINAFRALHKAPALTWDESLAADASILATRCVLEKDTSIGDENYGQSIFMYASIDANTLTKTQIANLAVEDFYSENAYFSSSDYGQPTPSLTNFDAWDNYTQLIWASSTTFGAAVQYCPAGTLDSDNPAWLVVINYSAPGNIDGQYDTNVFPLQGTEEQQ